MSSLEDHFERTSANFEFCMARPLTVVQPRIALPRPCAGAVLDHRLSGVTMLPNTLVVFQRALSLVAPQSRV